MRYDPIDSALFTENRKRLTARLLPKAIAIVNANDIMPTNADGTMNFRQNSDLFYLTGVDQEETILLLFPESSDPKFREVLFVRKTSELTKVWEGAKLDKEAARKTTGIETIYWLGEFDAVFRSLMMEAEHVYLNSNEHRRATVDVETRELRFIRSCQNNYPLHRYERLAPLLAALRVVKSEPEIALIQRACDITKDGFHRVLSFVKPGVIEYEIEAEYLHEFVRQGSRGFAYPPIIASGVNNCILHYCENDKPCQDGDLLLMDVAAEYANYNADMTRTIPVSGRFTSRQRSVYDAVLRIMRAASALLRPGVIIRDYQKEVGKLMESELIGLGLLEKEKVKNQNPDEPLYREFFMHGTSHHLGLDVHDVGAAEAAIQIGNVFTVEPGIYIAKEELGIRLENDIVVGKKKNFDLMANIPIEAEEIEDLMNL